MKHLLAELWWRLKAFLRITKFKNKRRLVFEIRGDDVPDNRCVILDCDPTYDVAADYPELLEDARALVWYGPGAWHAMKPGTKPDGVVCRF